MKLPLRKALLIASQSPGSGHLRGIYADIERKKQFLFSANGGLWRSDEIEVLYDLPVSRVRKKIASAIAEYTVIYFSGHGITRYGNKFMLSMVDGEIQDIECINGSPRQRIFIDACRNLEKSQAAIGAVDFAHEQFVNFTGSAIRDAFDKEILCSPYGVQIIHATNVNSYAFENTVRNGGHFSLALFDSVSDFQRSGQKTMISIDQILEQTQLRLTNRRINQYPTVYRRGNLQVPFAYVSPELVTGSNESFIPARRQSGNNGEVIAAGVMLILLGAWIFRNN